MTVVSLDMRVLHMILSSMFNPFSILESRVRRQRIQIAASRLSGDS